MKKLLYLLLFIICSNGCCEKDINSNSEQSIVISKYKKHYIPGKYNGLVVDGWTECTIVRPKNDTINKKYIIQLRTLDGELIYDTISRFEYSKIILGDTITNIDPKYKQYKTR